MVELFFFSCYGNLLEEFKPGFSIKKTTQKYNQMAQLSPL